MPHDSKDMQATRFEVIAPKALAAAAIRELALVGDSVYSVYMRTLSVAGKTGTVRPEMLESAGFQAKLLRLIDENLTEEERDLIRQGRNCSKARAPRGAKIMDYRFATALEALLGRLLLSGNHERLLEILGHLGLKAFEICFHKEIDAE